MMNSAAAETINVLLVEDDIVDATWVRRALDVESKEIRYPFLLEHVDRLETALTRLERKDIQIILLDLGLPDTDTHTESVERIHKFVPDIPIVVLSGNSYESTGPVVLEKGALYFFPKNAARADMLCRTIQVTLETHRLQVNLRRVIEQSIDGMLVVDENNNVLFSNPAARQMLAMDTTTPAIFDQSREKGEIVEALLPGNRTVEVQTVDLEWNGKTAEMITLRDVSRRKRLEAQLHQSQKMEAIGILAGGVAHDFNNILTVIRGYADMLLEAHEESDVEFGDLTEISQAAARGASVTRQLLTFSRQEVSAPQSLNLNEVVENIEKMLRRLIGEDIELRFSSASDIPNIVADPGHMEQLIVNLAVNAKDAMLRGGTLSIETRMVTVDDGGNDNDHFNKRVPPGRYVVLSVTDTGHGIAKDVLPHIFEPFYTTKSVGKGSGLGLSMVYGVVEQSGGTIWAYSEPGQGACFEIYLPVDDRVEDSSNDDAVATQDEARGGRVLLVEDETSVRQFAARILRARGFEVFEAENGATALEVMASSEWAADVLLTDVIMPGMSGPELAERLQQSWPDLPVIYMSGYTKDTVVRRGVMAGETGFLPKPFKASELVAKVTEVLGALKQA